MRRSIRIVGIVALSSFIGACGGDATGPQLADVTGTWALTLSNLSGSGVACSATGVTANLTQSGSTFTGSYSGGTITCMAAGQTASQPMATGDIINGKVDGNQVTFDVDTTDAPFTGTVDGNAMTGTGTVTYDAGAPLGVIVLTGNWEAAKQ